MKKVVTIGGGTGSFTLLSGLKKYPLELSAIVSMADDGGSTGILRDELGVLPPGDVRQCLVALSDTPDMLRELKAVSRATVLVISFCPPWKKSPVTLVGE